MRLDDARPWFDKVDDDLTSIVLLGGRGTVVPSSCCFHCQQAVEKALKAVLVAIEVEPPRTHDLRLLVRHLEALGYPLDSTIHESVFTLTSYAVDFRYPGLDLDLDAEEVHEAVVTTSEVVRWSLAQLGVEAGEVGLEILENDVFKAEET